MTPDQKKVYEDILSAVKTLNEAVEKTPPIRGLMVGAKALVAIREHPELSAVMAEMEVDLLENKYLPDYAIIACDKDWKPLAKPKPAVS